MATPWNVVSRKWYHVHTWLYTSIIDHLYVYYDDDDDDDDDADDGADDDDDDDDDDDAAADDDDDDDDLWCSTLFAIFIIDMM